ncbi:TPA: hypothetical protein NV714_004896 [Escherichia coli]|nr:hypothetical protein [Escherichia coli]
MNILKQILNIFTINKEEKCCPVCGRYYAKHSFYNADFCAHSHTHDKPKDIYEYPINRLPH